MTNYAAGHHAEVIAADNLRKLGYKIHALNWRTRQCEIDIIAQKQNCVYFVEVKYRANDAQGRGLDYITPKKLSQMAFAAELWTAQQKWASEYTLAAIEVFGAQFIVGDLTEIAF